MRTQSTLTERILHLSMPSVSSETLEKAVEAFRDYVKCKYPEYYCMSNNVWFYSMKKADDGGPSISNRTVKPEHVFWEKKNSAENNPAWRLKVSGESVILNYRKNSPSDCGTWEDLVSLYNDLVPFLAQRLNITQWEKFSVTYFFTYGLKSISDKKLVRKDWIEVKKLLQPFASMASSAGFKSFLPQYFWDQSWICEKQGKDYIVNTQLETNSRASAGDDDGLEIRLFLAVRPNAPQKCRGIDWNPLFALLRENYEAILAPYAKKTLMEDFK